MKEKDLFKIIGSENISEIQAEGKIFRHKRSGATIYYLSLPKNCIPIQESAFCFCFRTPPPNRKGVPHIIEHSVFCGSKNFPLKEPFADLLKTTVHSYLNAVTYPDQTLYPAASYIEKNFLQLLRVYGDAVFFPLLQEEVFSQEGVRLALDRDGELSWQGIVYNEMKGYYSELNTLIKEQCLSGLFPPRHPNHFDSGGDPLEIVKLSYREFLEFYRNYYHPGNCRIIISSPIDCGTVLRYLDEWFLQYFTEEAEQPRLSVPPLVKPWSKGRILSHVLPPYDLENTPWWESETEAPDCSYRSAVISWLLPEQNCFSKTLQYKMMAELLIGNAASPMELSLLESHLGTTLSENSGMDFDRRQPVFNIGLNDYRSDDPYELLRFVHQNLHEIVRKGFSAKLWKSAVNRLEFALFNQLEGWEGGKILHYTLELAKASHCYSESPYQIFRLRENLEAIKREGSCFFQDLCKRLFQDNQHWTLNFFQTAEVDLRRQSELELLETKRQELVEADPDWEAALHQNADRLRGFQSREDPPELQAKILPLCRKDLPRREVGPEIQYKKSPSIDFSFCPNSPAQLVHIDFVFDTRGWGTEQSFLLSLFTDIFDDLGLPGKGYDKVAQEMAVYIGEIDAELDAQGSLDRPGIRQFCRFHLGLRSSDGNNLKRGIELFLQMLAGSDWRDSNRLKAQLQSRYYSLAQNPFEQTMHYAVRRAASQVRPLHFQEELWYGFPQILLLEKMLSPAERKGCLSALAEQMESLRERLLSSPLSCMIQADPVYFDTLQDIIGETLAGLGVSSRRKLNHSLEGGFFSDLLGEVLEQRQEPEVWFHPSLQEGIGTCLRSVSYRDALHPAMVLLGRILENGYVWEEARIKKGAYGVLVEQGHYDDAFLFGTERDTDPCSGIFYGGLQHIAAGFRTNRLVPAGQRELDGAVIQEMGSRSYSPPAPRNVLYRDFRRRLYGLNPAVEDAWYSQLSGVEPRQLGQAAELLLERWEQRSEVLLVSTERPRSGWRTRPLPVYHPSEAGEFPVKIEQT